MAVCRILPGWIDFGIAIGFNIGLISIGSGLFLLSIFFHVLVFVRVLKRLVYGFVDGLGVLT